LRRPRWLPFPSRWERPITSCGITQTINNQPVILEKTETIVSIEGATMKGIVLKKLLLIYFSKQPKAVECDFLLATELCL
jgi:hypothetical protein